MRVWIKTLSGAAMAFVLAFPLWHGSVAQEGLEDTPGPSERERPAESVGPVSFVMDTGVFYTEDGLPVVEVYLEAPYDALPFARRAGGYVSRIEVVAVFLGRSGEQAGGDTWNRDLWVEEYDETIDPEKSYRALARFEMPPGEYHLKLSCGALGSNLKGEAQKRLVVPERPSKELSLSDIRMGVCGVEGDSGAETEASFIPSGHRSFGIETPVICALAEAYSPTDISADSLDIQAYARDEEGRIVWEITRTVERTGRRTLLTFGVPTDSLAWGVYKLAINARAGDSEASVIGWFEADETRIDVSMELDLFMDLLSLVATEEELETFASLGGSERRSYLDEIWKKRDPDRSTPRNEFKIRFFSRLKHARAHYAEPGREGWQTDRGRVFIKNGPPNRIDTRHGVIGSLSPDARLEVWYYDATNTHYVFEDFGGTGQFTLVDVVQG